MRPLRIAYVVGSLTYGGSERQMLALAERLPRERFRVEFILLGAPGPYAEQAQRSGARVISLGARPRRSGSFALFALGASAKALRYVKTVRRGRYDVVDAWLFPSYGLAAVTRPLTGIPVLVAGRRSLNDFKRRFGPLERLLDQIARRWVDVIVANSHAVASDVRARERVDVRKLRVIRNGIERIPPLDPVERAAQRAAWGVGSEDVVVGCVANYKHGKGHPALLDAFAAVAMAFPNIRLVLVGDGSLRPELERRVRELNLTDRVRLTGTVLDPRPLYPAFDLVVQASESEGLPNALLEAAAAGRAIVATATGGTPEIVEHGRTGFLVRPGDVAGLATAMTRLTDDEELRATFGAAAQALVLETFGMDRFVGDFAALYEEMAARKGLRR